MTAIYAQDKTDVVHVLPSGSGNAAPRSNSSIRANSGGIGDAGT
jgi:hypothetical protein